MDKIKENAKEIKSLIVSCLDENPNNNQLLPKFWKRRKNWNTETKTMKSKPTTVKTTTVAACFPGTDSICPITNDTVTSGAISQNPPKDPLYSHRRRTTANKRIVFYTCANPMDILLRWYKAMIVTVSVAVSEINCPLRWGSVTTIQYLLG